MEGERETPAHFGKGAFGEDNQKTCFTAGTVLLRSCQMYILGPQTMPRHTHADDNEFSADFGHGLTRICKEGGTCGIECDTRHRGQDSVSSVANR
jgi:hypothetical protein